MLRSPLASKAVAQEGEGRMALIQLGWFPLLPSERDGERPSRDPNPRTALRPRKPRLFKG